MKICQSVCIGTWFEQAKLPPTQILLITHCFAHRQSYELTKIESSLGDHSLSSRTIRDWFSYCREICMISMANKYQQRGKIGGPGHIVQIDECQIGRKYHLGQAVEGDWILGMIDVETNEVRMAVCPNNRRDSNTLYQLIAEHVELTSTIQTDAWRGYYGLLADGFAAHLSVNHSENSMDLVTSNIDSRWRTLRKRLSTAGIRRGDIDVHICEYLWHQDCKNRGADPFQELIDDIRQAYPVV